MREPSALDDPSCCRPEAGLVVGRTPHCVCPPLRGGRRTLRDSRARWSRAQNRVDSSRSTSGRRDRVGLQTEDCWRFLKSTRPQAPLSIFLASIESLEKRKLTSPPVGSAGDCAPAISPDGRTVAFNRVSAAGGIFLVPVAGGEPTRVTRDQIPFCERLAWTADGRELVFTVQRRRSRIE